jgi:ParB-like chromosome segregation protein Spo0J
MDAKRVKKPIAKIKVVTSGNQYSLVPLLDIRVVDRPEEGHEHDQLFFNQRSLDSMDTEQMLSLRNDIATSGLHTPLIVRAITTDKTDSGDIVRIDLIAGERRLRSLLKLYEDNPLVYCRRTKTTKPAQEVYGLNVPCEICYNISDEEALGISWRENFQRQNLSVQEEINAVERLMRRGLRQEEIAVSLGGTNITWVSQTCNFRKELPADAFRLLLEGRLSRHGAVQIMSFHKDDREKLVREAICIEQEETEITKKRMRRLVEDAEDDVEMAKAAASKIPQFKKKIATAARKVVEAKTKMAKVEASAGTIRQGHLQRGAVAAAVTPKTAKVLTRSMIQQFLIDTPTQWVEINKIDPLTKQPYPPDKLKVIIETANHVLAGNIDTGGIIRRVMVESGEWEMPEGVQEHDPELLEISDGDEELE